MSPHHVELPPVVLECERLRALVIKCRERLDPLKDADLLSEIDLELNPPTELEKPADGLADD